MIKISWSLCNNVTNNNKKVRCIDKDFEVLTLIYRFFHIRCGLKSFYIFLFMTDKILFSKPVNIIFNLCNVNYCIIIIVLFLSKNTCCLDTANADLRRGQEEHSDVISTGYISGCVSAQTSHALEKQAFLIEEKGDPIST